MLIGEDIKPGGIERPGLPFDGDWLMTEGVSPEPGEVRISRMSLAIRYNQHSAIINNETSHSFSFNQHYTILKNSRKKPFP
ncbi:hypothetical protein JOC77_002127 [Peribacillus deserti]|uniref:Uncharacterized protein n=1 Tax=Peribacillus deserti TaxID=673318 RepID=A0ABS2QK89_9BACI|nr:hypothetical protein [Peribacillus deserti]MBM7692696.1 hypothetical protein [Peribacillus deserti]